MDFIEVKVAGCHTVLTDDISAWLYGDYHSPAYPYLAEEAVSKHQVAMPIPLNSIQIPVLSYLNDEVSHFESVPLLIMSQPFLAPLITALVS